MVSGKVRPYFKSNVAELERLYATHGHDRATLQALARELSFRETERAHRLALKVGAALQPGVPTSSVDRASVQPSRLSPTVRVIPPLTLVDTVQSYKPLGDKDDPAAIVADWIALEALSPQTYKRPEEMAGGEKSRIVDLNDPLPWQRDIKARPNTRLFYHVILGTIDMDRAGADLIKAFGSDEEHSRPERSKAIIASLLVDKHGVPVEKGLVVSSFAWALPKALAGQAGGLGAWPKAEAEVRGRLEDFFRRVDENDQLLPVDRASIDTAFHWLVASFGLDETHIEAPSLAIKVFHWFRAKTPPEALLLNSFFLNDLARAKTLIETGAAPEALAAYMGMTKPKEKLDVRARPEVLEAILAPKRFPLARWPARGGHPLVLLQQAAVNIGEIELAESEGIVAVNGPPGTGKTTLLRDVIAARLWARAEAMVAFDDPNTAFTASGHEVSYGRAAVFQAYHLHETLKGHEIVVASSNNKAVENISRELPGINAVDSDPTALNYFKSVSDCVFSGNTGSEGDDSPAEPVETWGLIAAVMGNAANRAAFQKTFWWDDDYAFRLYLKAAAGQKVTIEIKDPDTGEVIGQRLPAIIDAESPPSPERARRNWKAVRARFIAEKQTIEQEVEELEAVRGLCLAMPQLRADAEVSADALRLAVDALNVAEAALDEARRAVETERLNLSDLWDQRQALLPLRPGLWARLFRRKAWRVWSEDYRMALAAEKTARKARADAEEALKAAVEQKDIAAVNERQRRHAHEVNAGAVAEAREVIASRRAQHGDILLDEVFAARTHEQQQLVAPWISMALHARRARLFETALAVQRAFIDAAAQKFLHNISVLFSEASSIASDPARRNILPDLWASLFTVVPVLSTTFASLERMIGDLPPASLGWLLIDEAGQATPQAAVGALMRCKRAVVVGDPLQIEPVVSLPEKLNTKLAEYFTVTRTRWTAPEASAQTLADQASRFVGTFDGDKGVREVGVPLLVHRRCRNPMFDISNAIAYDRQMVMATSVRPQSDAVRCLGQSRWIDVTGEAGGKWHREEGEVFIRLLTQLADADVKVPDIFVITPFRVVAEELRRCIRQERDLMTRLGASAEEWARHRIGTIHTFQGREADMVFLVLGAADDGQIGARKWATGRPNILNVAVSRQGNPVRDRLKGCMGWYGMRTGIGQRTTVSELAALPVLQRFAVISP